VIAFALGSEVQLSTHDERIAALEKDAATMRRDIAYKLDDTNSVVTIIRGIVGNQGQDIKEIRNQVRIVNVRLDGIDTRLEGLKEEIRAIKDQQDGQGQDVKDIKRHLDALEETFSQRFASLEGKLEQVLQMLTNPHETGK
jgi:chromosome segregation ATPase